MAYTTDELLSIIKKRSFLPVSQETFSDQDLLDMATDEMLSMVVPAVLSTREEWYVTCLPTAVDSTVTELDIPSRAIGGSLREVTLSVGETEFPLARLDLEDRTIVSNTGNVSAFYLQGNQIKFLGAQEGIVNQYFHARPGHLVPGSQCVTVNGYNTVAKFIEVNGTVPAEWQVGTKIDIIKASPHFEYRAMSLTITNVAGSTIEVAEEFSNKIVPGDWVTLEDTSPVPQIPVEWFQYLAQTVVTQIFNSQGDAESGKTSYYKSEQLRKSALSLMAPRISGELKKAVSPKNRGYLPGFRSRGW